MSMTDAILHHHYRTQGPFHAQIAAFLQAWSPDDELWEDVKHHLFRDHVATKIASSSEV